MQSSPALDSSLGTRGLSFLRAENVPLSDAVDASKSSQNEYAVGIYINKKVSLSIQRGITGLAKNKIGTSKFSPEMKGPGRKRKRSLIQVVGAC